MHWKLELQEVREERGRKRSREWWRGIKKEVKESREVKEQGGERGRGEGARRGSVRGRGLNEREGKKDTQNNEVS